MVPVLCVIMGCGMEVCLRSVRAYKLGGIRDGSPNSTRFICPAWPDAAWPGEPRVSVSLVSWTHSTIVNPGPPQRSTPNRPLAHCLCCSAPSCHPPTAGPPPDGSGPTGVRPALPPFAYD